MLKKYLYALILFCSPVAEADDWLCKEESSLRRGNQVYACGVGQGRTEDEARTNAFKAAASEFDRICEASSDCQDHNITVTPQRTTCEGNTCHRLLVFTIGGKMNTQKLEDHKRKQEGVKIAHAIKDLDDEYKREVAEYIMMFTNGKGLPRY